MILLKQVTRNSITLTSITNYKKFIKFNHHPHHHPYLRNFQTSHNNAAAATATNTINKSSLFLLANSGYRSCLTLKISSNNCVQWYGGPQFNRQYCLIMKPRVYVTRPDVSSVGVDLLKDECDVTSWSEEIPVPREELLKNVGGKDAIFCALTDKIDAEVLDQAGPNLKVVATISVGYDHIDVAECKKRGIRIGYTPDVLTDATAELTVALLLATSRRLIEANKEVSNGGWKAWAPNWMCGQGLKDSTVGIVGFGRIGQEVARRIQPFKPTKLVYSNRSDRSAEAATIGAERVTFDQLISTCDFIILTCALTPETTNLINSSTIDKMKTNAIIVNTSRGGIINQTDLYEALKNNRIRAAGLDVTTPEPLPLDSPLLTLNNVVILPHIGSADIDTRIEMSRITACNILAGLKGVKMISEL